MNQNDIERALHSALASCLPLAPAQINTRVADNGEWYEMQVWLQEGSVQSSTLVVRLSREAQDDLRASSRKTHDDLATQIEQRIVADVGDWLRSCREPRAPPQLIVIASDAVT